MEKDIAEIILEELRAHREESSKRHEQIDVRVRKVETWQSNADGKVTMIGVFGVLFGGFITWLTDLFHR